jgi:zinc finger protein
MSQQNQLFPSMGDIASRTEALPNVEDDDKRLAHDAPTLEEQEEGEEREVQEIESLCMRCHEQVSFRVHRSSRFV